MKKWICTIALSVLLLFGITAHALEITSIEIDGSNIVVKGVGDENEIYLKVIPKLSDENIIDNVFALKGVKPDDDGSFTVELVMPDSISDGAGGIIGTTGDYSVLLKGATTSSVTEFIKFVDCGDRQALIDSMSGKTSAKIVELFETTDNQQILRNLQIDMDAYNSLNYAKEDCIDVLMLNYQTENVTQDNIKLNMPIAIALTQINNQMEIDKALKTLDCSFEGKKYTEITDKNLTEWIVKITRNDAAYTTKAQFQTVYDTANVLYLINNAKYTDYDNLINQYDAVLNYKSHHDYDNAKGMSKEKQAKINEYIKRTLSSSPAESVEAFKEVYKDAINSVKSQSDRTDSLNGGSSGGKTASSVISGGPVPGVVIAKPALTDISEALWAEKEIKTLYEKKIISGYEDNSFKPNNTITREEFVVIILNALGISANHNIEAEYTDVVSGAWYEGYIVAATKEGLVSGVGDGKFGVGQNISRQDATVILSRCIENVVDIREYSGFLDDEKISPYAKGAVVDMYCKGIVNGMGNNMFNPTDNLTRAQAAKMVHDAFVAEGRL